MVSTPSFTATGNGFVARVDGVDLRQQPDDASIDALRQAFLEGYASVTRRRLPARIPFYVAVGLVRLAALPFRSREADWLAQTEAILERAAAVAEEVGGRAPVQPAVGPTAASPGRNCSS